MDVSRRQCLKAAVVGGATVLFAPLKFDFGLDAMSNFEVFQHPYALPLKIQTSTETITTSSIGDVGGVFIDRTRNLIKKVYALNMPSVGGVIAPKYNAPLYHNYFYENEKKAYSQLRAMGSRYIPEQISFNDEERSITMAYHGRDLLTNRFQDGWQPEDRHIEQIIEMSHEYRLAGFFKRNVCASNLIYDFAEDRLRAIDFKFIVPRTSDVVAQEIQHHHLLLHKIHADLPQQMEATFADFSLSHVRAYSDMSRQLYAQYTRDENNHELRLQLLKKIQAAV